MNEHAKQIRKPRCFLFDALAPSDLPAAEANRILNAFIADPHLPLAVFFDLLSQSIRFGCVDCVYPAGLSRRELGDSSRGESASLWRPQP